jgi:hypothetical protein
VLQQNSIFTSIRPKCHKRKESVITFYYLFSHFVANGKKWMNYFCFVCRQKNAFFISWPETGQPFALWSGRSYFKCSVGTFKGVDVTKSFFDNYIFHSNTGANPTTFEFTATTPAL